MTREEFDQKLRDQIAKGEITPMEAESEWDFFVNRTDTRESISGW